MTKQESWDWDGAFSCPDCGEEFLFHREDGFPEKWNLQVWHDHTGEEVVWRAAAYKTWRGRRRPKELKEMQNAVESQRRTARQKAKDDATIRVASTG